MGASLWTGNVTYFVHGSIFDFVDAFTDSVAMVRWLWCELTPIKVWTFEFIAFIFHATMYDAVFFPLLSGINMGMAFQLELHSHNTLRRNKKRRNRRDGADS